MLSVRASVPRLGSREELRFLPRNRYKVRCVVIAKGRGDSMRWRRRRRPVTAESASVSQANVRCCTHAEP